MTCEPPCDGVNVVTRWPNRYDNTSSNTIDISNLNKLLEDIDGTVRGVVRDVIVLACTSVANRTGCTAGGEVHSGALSGAIADAVMYLHLTPRTCTQ